VVVDGRLVIPARELRWRFSRSSGPGGQGVNTADSRVELTWDLASSPALSAEQKERALSRLGARVVAGRLTVAASEHRSQLRNRDAALARLAAIVRDATAPGPRSRRATAPTRGSQRRRAEAKRRRGETKRLRRAPGAE
jgi:ribosome-associated protein